MARGGAVRRLLALADVPGEHGDDADGGPISAASTAWVVGSTPRSYAPGRAASRAGTGPPTVHRAFTRRRRRHPARLGWPACARPSMKSSIPIFDDLAEHLRQVEVAVQHATAALLDRRRGARRAGDLRETPRSTWLASGSRTRRSRCSPCSSRSPATCAGRRRAADGERAGADGRPVRARRQDRPAAGARTSRCPTQVRPTVSRMAEVAEDMVGPVAQIIAERDVEAALALGRDDEEMDQLRRTSFAELLPTTGRTASRPRSTWRCWALLRADRRPRGLGGQPRGLRGHRPASARARGSRPRLSGPGWRRPRPRPRPRLGVEVAAAGDGRGAGRSSSS